MKEYFSHDHGARHDKKVVALVTRHKSAGYGIFWATNEMMHEEGGELELDNLTFDAIAKQLNEDPKYIEQVINDCINLFKLYIQKDENITSNRVKKNLSEITTKKQVKIDAGREGGIKSGESRRSKQNEATLQANEPMLEGTNQIKLKESKLNEIKEKEIKLKKNKENLGSSEIYPWSNFYYKSFNQVHKFFPQLTEKGFLKWKEFVELILEKNYTEVFNCKFITPTDFENLEFPSQKWDETLRAILSTGIKPEHNLFFRIPQFIPYTEKNGHKSINGSDSGAKLGTSEARIKTAKNW